MPLSRRKFIQTGAIAATGTALVKTSESDLVSPVRAARSDEAAFVVAARLDSPLLEFGIQQLKASLATVGKAVRRQPSNAPQRPDLIIVTGESEAQALKLLPGKGATLQSGGYRIVKSHLQNVPVLVLHAADEKGAMFGLLDLAEQARPQGSLERVAEKTSNPRFAFRAIKFNLPWMSYRRGEALQQHSETCHDLKFWEQFLDMMAQNRYNALTLWNLHPFTFMIRPTNFPEASSLSDAELAQWQTFWKTLFRMAKERGIETYMVNWNTFVSPEFAKAHNVAQYSEKWDVFGEGDTSEIIKSYTGECVTQLIDEYPDLTGLGITLGERMGGMTPQEREDWLIETFGAGIKAAKWPIKFIHRAPLSADKGSGGSTGGNTSLLTRRGIDDLKLDFPPIVEIKFNWSHAYSSPKLLVTHGGKLTDDYWNPVPSNYKLAWMIRNEDFFVLRWGDPEFVRQHIAQNGQEYVGGYFIGSECYIPAKNYLDKADLPGRAAYAFQRQWLLYMLWGRLLYDSSTPDSVFEQAFDERYGKGTGAALLPAYTRSSRMPLRLATFHGFTWDYTLYSEGFLAPKGGDAIPQGSGKDGFLTVNDIIKCQPLDPNYVSIVEYVQAVQEKRAFPSSRITPLALADQLDADGTAALKSIGSLTKPSAQLAQEVADVTAWSHLSLYFAHKLRAGVALQTFRVTGEAQHRAKAVEALQLAATQWDAVIGATEPFHDEVPLLLTGDKPFSWQRYRESVQQDITMAQAEVFPVALR